MKKYINVTILALIIGLVFTACDKTTSLEKMEKQTVAIENLQNKSHGLQNPDEAFQLLRDLNAALTKVKSVCLSLDAEYQTADDARKAEIDQKFDALNKRIDTALKDISKNTEKFHDDQNVSDMIVKLKKVMISQ